MSSLHFWNFSFPNGSYYSLKFFQALLGSDELILKHVELQALSLKLVGLLPYDMPRIEAHCGWAKELFTHITVSSPIPQPHRPGTHTSALLPVSYVRLFLSKGRARTPARRPPSPRTRRPPSGDHVPKGSPPLAAAC